MSTDFKVKAGEFEGPLDLLLDLIEKKKLHISQISLAQVADDYVDYLNNHPELPMSDMADFVMIASTLMLIKSIALLPTLELTPEEQSDVEELEKRLQTYQRIKELSLHIKNRFGKQVIYGREQSRQVHPIFSPSPEITLVNIFEVIKRLLASLPIKETVPKATIRKVVSLEEVIDNLTNRIQRALKMRFSDFVQDKTDKINIVVSFLGMLELVKRGIIRVEQNAHFEDISIETENPNNTPRYI
jgi:segregation and condensation protein A